MDRSNIDPFWNHVVKMNDGSIKCEFCGHPFARDTSISRIKWHFSGEKGHGVAICGQVPKDVQKAALLAMRDGNKRQKTIASSNNVNDNAISSCPQEENNEVNNLAGDAGRIQMAVQGTEQGVGEGRTSSRAAAGNHMENLAGERIHIDTSITAEGLIVDAHKTRADASKAIHLVEKHQGVGVEVLPHAQELMDGLFAGEDDTNEDDRVPGWFMLDAPVGGQRIETNEEDRVPGWFMVDAPETGQRIEQMGQVLEQRIEQVGQVLEQGNGVDDLAGDGGRIQIEVQGVEQGAGEKRSSHLEAANDLGNTNGGLVHPVDRSISPQRLTGDAHETRGEASQAPDLVGQAIGRSWDDICNLLMEDDIENGTGGIAQTGAVACSSGGLTCNTNEIKGDALPITKLVGQAFEDNKKTIWSWLMNDEVSSIGIYGMGGVGKTTLVTHIYSQLLKKPDTFCHVYWITVSQDFSIKRLQNSIASRIDLDLSNEEEELHRTVKLSEELMKRQKWVLILDDLWHSFELRKVGIPIQGKGCKVILTTRSEKVCQRMDSQKKIKVKPLSKEEAWTLFMEKLGHDIAFSSEVKKIAQCITEECDGLPLGIITMAGTMKGVGDIHEWRNALEDLKQSRVRQDDMEEEVFRILRFSYVHLKDSTLQQCFLYCALFPEDFEIPREDLIAYLIDEGIIKGLKSREAEFDKGHSMLNRLENVCLLESVPKRYGDCRCVKMHDLIRDMAIQIQQGNFEIMVKAGAQLKELPDAEEWTENLVRVSLMQNQIQEIPSSYSPRCLNMSTLFLCFNWELKFITDSFFKQLHGLKVLNLSQTSIGELPDAVSNLVSLSALLLKRCWNLRHVPSLKKLRALKRLDLGNTALEKMPQGLKWLSNLRYLRLNGCGQKVFPSGILPKLSHLQVLIIEDLFVDGKNVPLTVKGKEVACLRKLETLECHFEHLSGFVEFIKSRDGTQSLSTYKIRVGQLDGLDYSRMVSMFSRNKSVGLGNVNIPRDGDFQVMFPNNIEELVICTYNDAIRSLCDVSSLIKYATELEVIRIWYCNSMESLVSATWFCSAPLPSPSCNGIFSSLKEFQCYNCRSMKKLFPLVLLPNLVNLEEVRVVHCEKMEEIIAARDEEGVMGKESSSCYSNIEFNLPKLRILELANLPQLKSICSAKLICNSLEEIEVWDCEKLKRMSLSLPLLDNGQPSAPPSLRRMIIYPKEWWESVVEWEHPNAKDVLRRFVKFY